MMHGKHLSRILKIPLIQSERQHGGGYEPGPCSQEDMQQPQSCMILASDNLSELALSFAEAPQGTMQTKGL